MPRRTECERLADPADPRLWTAHEHIDVTRITAGRQILLSGHKFWVADMTFRTTGWATGHPRPGHDCMADIGQVDLKLTHAQWKGCPAVDPPAKRMPADWKDKLVDLHRAATYLMLHPETPDADAVFLEAQLAPIIAFDTTGVKRG